MDSLNSSFTSISLDQKKSSENRWRRWNYECRDIPEHYCHKNSQRSSLTPDKCEFCLQNQAHKNENSRGESQERWNTYLKKMDSYADSELMLGVLPYEKMVLPSHLAEQVCFLKKLGVAFFHEGIKPNYDDPNNSSGGNFQFLMACKAGESGLLEKFDDIFLRTITAIFHEFPPFLIDFINGIFLRCEINPGKFLRGPMSGHYNDLMNLPCLFKFEIWIGNVAEKNNFNVALGCVMKEMKLEEMQKKKNIRIFLFNSKEKRDDEQKKWDEQREKDGQQNSQRKIK